MTESSSNEALQLELSKGNSPPRHHTGWEHNITTSVWLWRSGEGPLGMRETSTRCLFSRDSTCLTIILYVCIKVLPLNGFLSNNCLLRYLSVARSTSCNDFSVPTLGEHNWHNRPTVTLHLLTGWPSWPYIKLKRFGRESAQILTYRHTDGSVFIMSTADAGGCDLKSWQNAETWYLVWAGTLVALCKREG